MSYRQSVINRLKMSGVTVKDGTVTHGRSAECTTYVSFTPRVHNSLPLVLLHGTGNDAIYCHGHVIEQLLAKGHRIMSLDLPGHGTKSTTVWRSDQFLPVVEESVDSIFRDHGIPKAALVGFSLGGALALGLIARRPSLFTRAVSIGAPSHVLLTPMTALVELSSFLKRDFWEKGWRFGLFNMLPAFGPFRRDLFPIRLESMVTGSMRYVEAVNEVLTKIRVTLRETPVTKPTLLIYGDRDRIAPVSQYRDWAICIADPRRLEIAGANHFDLFLRDTTTDAVQDFLN